GQRCQGARAKWLEAGKLDAEPRAQADPEGRSTRYSVRSASMGFTEAALRAGTKLASNAARPSTPATPTRVGISQLLTPNSIFRASAAAAMAATAPTLIPSAASHPASFRIIRYTERCSAPIAMRTPISRVL